jgi:ferric-dicitrate binding protein FerR (iron transport regulator)
MQDDHDDDTRAGDDAKLEALLRTAGPRPQPPADVTAAVRAAVADEWRAAVASRRPRRPLAPWLAAAAVAAAAVGVWLLAPGMLQPSPGIATVARLTGAVEYRHAGSDAWQALDAAASVASGDEVRTLPMGRVSLRVPDGLELRLDAGTTVAFDDDDAARLQRGRVYVDAGSGAGAFTVATALGDVHHLGTRYSVALAGDTLDVAVREGSVAVDHDRKPVVARAGERITLQRDGRLLRSQVLRYGEQWQWAQAVAPTLAIDGRTLDELLAWAARETGRQLVYTSPEAAREAEQTVLKGSVEGLSPEEAVAAVLTTTPSLEHRWAGAQIRIAHAATGEDPR